MVDVSAKKMEKQIQAEILRYLEKVPRCFVFKTIVSNINGVPDIICCYKGIFFAFEVKTQYYNATKIQRFRMNSIGAAGGVAHEVKSLDDVKRIIKTAVEHGAR